MPGKKKSASKKSPIHVKDDKSLEEYNKELTNGASIIVLYYSPTCPHCMMMEPAWNDFERKANPRHSRIARVRSDYMPRIGGPKDIMGYPTIYHVKNGEKMREHNGSRDIESFMQFLHEIEKQSGGKKTIRRKRRKKSKSLKKTYKRRTSRKKSNKRKKRYPSKK
jgi:thioredoxin-like negative regulator of GroEL